MAEKTYTSGNNILSQQEYDSLLSHAELGLFLTRGYPEPYKHASTFYNSVVDEVAAGKPFSKETASQMIRDLEQAREASAKEKIEIRQFNAAIVILIVGKPQSVAVSPI